LYVQQESLDVHFLASSHVGTPDPRQSDPPHGQRLLVAWRFPKDLLAEELTLRIMVRFWDESEKIVEQPIRERWAQRAFDFPCADSGRRILSYRAVVTTEAGEVVASWQHPLWTEWIEIGEGQKNRVPAILP